MNDIYGAEKEPYVLKKYYLFSSYILSLIIAIIVYYTGGTPNVYANLMYIPIAIIASTNGKKQAVISAVISGLLLGPKMPLYIASEPNNWIIRLMIYAIVAFVIGYFADNNNRMLDEIIKKENEKAKAQMATIYSLVKLSEARDDETGFHVQRVAEYCRLLTTQLSKKLKYRDYISDSYIENIYEASPLHDIGKVGIPDNILLKPGKLSPDEFEVMKSHTTIGANTLKEVETEYPGNGFFEMGIIITHSHHEKWDGSGYPLGLKGDAIPLSGRIMALADVYDALRSRRVYKDAYSHEKCLEIIKESSGSHFDPEIVEVFLECEAEFDSIYNGATG